MWIRLLMAYFSNPALTRKLADSAPIRYAARATVRIFLEGKQRGRFFPSQIWIHHSVLTASQKYGDSDLIGKIKAAFREGKSKFQ
ncbi:unnamed protein product [Trichobilharzia szidati]|nr:unnamed protein product [Trichobilharzia szidati]